MKKPAKVVPNLQLKRAREYRGWSQEDVARVFRQGHRCRCKR